MSNDKDFLVHYGIKGQKWGVRRFQNEDGTLTEEGKKRYGNLLNREKEQVDKERSKIDKAEKRNIEIQNAKDSNKNMSFFNRIKSNFKNKKLIDINDKEIEKARDKIEEILEGSKDLKQRKTEIDARLKENMDYLKHPEMQDDEEFTKLIKRENKELKKDLDEIEKRERQKDDIAEKLIRNESLFSKDVEIDDSECDKATVKRNTEYLKKNEKEILKNCAKAAEEYLDGTTDKITNFKPGLIAFGVGGDNNGYMISGTSNLKDQGDRDFCFNFWFKRDSNKGLIPYSIEGYD